MPGMLPELGSTWRRNCPGGMDVIVAFVAPLESSGETVVCWYEPNGRGDGRVGATVLQNFVLTYVRVSNPPEEEPT